MRRVMIHNRFLQCIDMYVILMWLFHHTLIEDKEIRKRGRSNQEKKERNKITFCSLIDKHPKVTLYISEK